MPSRYDLTGQRFGRMTVLEYAGSYEFPCGTKKPMWICRCDCGKVCEVIGQNLLNGRTRSCGCLRSETSRRNCLKRSNKCKKSI